MKLVNPKKPAEMFIKAGLFGVFFLIVLIFFMIASKNVKSVETGSKILNGVTKYKGFSEKEKENLKSRNAGFWHYESDSGNTISVLDRFELKTNGIFWEVARYGIGLPSGKTSEVMYVATGYMNPFTQLAPNNTDSILCDVHIIKQADVLGADTCYAPSGVDTTWVVVADGHRFRLADRAYALYDTTGPALHGFFWGVALDLVDKITLRQCFAGGPLAFYLKKAITADMASVKPQTLTMDNIQKIIDAYYRRFLEALVAGAFGGPAKKDHVTVAFSVGADGKVFDARVEKISTGDERLKRLIAGEIDSWVFPAMKNSAPAFHLEREFWF